MKNKSVLILVFLIILVVTTVSVIAGNGGFDTLKDKKIDEPILTERTQSSDTYRNGDGTYTTTLYSGIKYVYEDDTWKEPQNARSLKDKGFEVKYIDVDEDYVLDISDFNYTSITFEMEVPNNKKNKNIPVKVWEYDNKEGDLKDYKQNYKIKKDKKVKQNKNKAIYTEEFGFDKIIEIGGNSTTITLTSGNISDDTFVDSNNVNVNFDPSNIKIGYNSADIVLRTYIKFNNQLPLGIEVIDSSLYLYIVSLSSSGSPVGLNASFHSIINNSWLEEDVTWNNQPCGTLKDNLSCQNYMGDNILVPHDNGYKSYNVTSIIDSVRSESKLSLLIKLTNESINYSTGTRSIGFASKDYVDEIRRPYLSITYIPGINIISPTPYEMFAENSTTINFNISTANSMDTCYLEIDNVNNTMVKANTTSFSLTGLSITEGIKSLLYYCNQTSDGIWKKSNRVTFYLDTIKPLIDFSTGTESNNTNFDRDWVYMNVSLTEANLVNITYNLYTEAGALQDSQTYATSTIEHNFTSVPDGSYFYNVTVIDIINNQNSTETRKITLDDTAPTINIISPTASTYPTNESLSLTYTSIDTTIGVDDCWYKILNSTSGIEIDNTTLTDCNNITFNVSKLDTYTLTVYSNDTLSNLGSSDVTFQVSLSSPAINLNYPADNQYLNNGTNVYFNFTSTDTDGLDTCQLWSNFTNTWAINYTWNSPTSGVMNFTQVNLSEESYIWNVWCNDTTNNYGFALNNQTFTIDETYPKLTLSQPTGTKTSRSDIQAIWNTSDTNLDSCKYNVYRGITEEISNTTVNCLLNSTTFNLTLDGVFILNFYASDLAGNVNHTISPFTVDTVSEEQTGGGGGGTEIRITQVIEGNGSGFIGCGDGICGEGEDPYNCWEDCKINYDTLIKCVWDDDIECNWKQNWFPSTIVLFLIIVSLYAYYISSKKGKKKDYLKNLFR